MKTTPFPSDGLVSSCFLRHGEQLHSQSQLGYHCCGALSKKPWNLSYKLKLLPRCISGDGSHSYCSVFRPQNLNTKSEEKARWVRPKMHHPRILSSILPQQGRGTA